MRCRASGAQIFVSAALGLAYAGLSVAADPGRGAEVFQGTCIACHGSDGSGSFPGVPDLTDKAGPLSQDDAVLLERMANGFQSPGSTMAMPARGGNPALTDADLEALLQYMRMEFLQAR
jgi:mono/diheme cytochrome c family protein